MGLRRLLLHTILASLPIIAAAASGASAGQPLEPYSAEYKVRISVLSGRLTTELRPQADGYEAVHVIEPQGLARMMKDGEISDAINWSSTVPY